MNERDKGVRSWAWTLGSIATAASVVAVVAVGARECDFGLAFLGPAVIAAGAVRAAGHRWAAAAIVLVAASALMFVAAVLTFGLACAR